MKATCTLKLTFHSKADAQKILQSLKVDDLEYVQSSQKDKSIQATMEATKLSSLLHTLDDYLACVSVAEKIIHKKEQE